MLRTRVVSGVLIVAILVLLLYVDQWLAPWFPLWFLLSAFVMGAIAWELDGLMKATPSRPIPQVVAGGLLAMLAANWMPHLIQNCETCEPVSAIVIEPSLSVTALAWPFLCFTEIGRAHV